MAMGKVYFVESEKGIPIAEKLVVLLEKAGDGLENKFKGNIALKMHMGERNNETFIKPFYVRQIAEIVKKQGGNPFVTDTTTIYKLGRYTAMDYYKTAFEHGVLPSYLGCPVIIADGLKDDGVEVSENVEIARAIYESDAMLVISHATGHGTASFGGAIKNVAMGCVTKKSKQYQHSVTKPIYDRELCNCCDACREECKFDAIEVKENGDRELLKEKCVGCGYCIAACEAGVLHLEEGAKEQLQLRIAEVANAVLKNLPYSDFIFVNFLIDITPFCDCEDRSPEYICPDIGILASQDIVAIDQATIDLIGKQSFEGDPTIQVREAHRWGLGELQYELCRI
jgi:uncharacterized Fe-S center protein